MAELQQKNTDNANYLIWFGHCEEPECTNFPLARHDAIIDSVYEFNTDGYPRVYKSGRGNTQDIT